MPCRAPSNNRLMPLLACLLGLAGAACTTETRSLTHVQASLEAAPGLAQVRLSHLARGEANRPMTLEQSAAADKLDVRFDGQPLLFDDGQPVRAYSSSLLSSYWVPEAETAIEFVRDGAVVVQTDVIDLAEDRFNYLILHGDPETPDLLVLESPLEARIVRIANLRKDGGALEYTMLDSDGEPIGDSDTIANGEGVSMPAPAQAAAVRLVAADGEQATHRINCNPSFSLVHHDEPLGLTLTPSAPESDEDWLAHCYDLDCACDAPE